MAAATDAATTRVGEMLFAALVSDNYPEFKRLLLEHKNADVNYMYGPCSLLAIAAFWDKPRFASLLLSQRGIIVNRQPREGVSPLSVAVAKSVAVTQLLLRHPDIDVNEENDDGATAFLLACGSNSIEALELLLRVKNDKGLNVQYCNNYGNTASHFACRYGYLSVVKILMKHDCFDAVACNSEGLCCIDYAAGHGYVEIMSYFLDNFLGKSKDTGLNFVMHEKCDICRLLTHSVTNKQHRCVKLLLKYLDVSSNINIIYGCLDYLLGQPCRFSFSALIGCLRKAGILAFNASNKLLNRATNICVDKFIIRTCFSLWHELCQLYSALNLLYATVVLGNNFKNSEAEQFTLQIQLHFLCKCLGGDDTLRDHTILYFAATHGLVSVIKMVLCRPINSLDIKSINSYVYNKNISILNLSMRHPKIADILLNIFHGLNIKVDSRKIKEFRSWYRFLSHLSATIDIEKHPVDLCASEIVKWFHNCDEKYIQRNVKEPEWQGIHDGVHEFMLSLASEVCSLDPLFEFRPILVGSGKEKTRPYLPNEFDYHLVLLQITKQVNIYYRVFIIKNNIVKSKSNVYPKLHSFATDDKLRLLKIKAHIESLIRNATQNVFNKNRHTQLNIEKAFLEVKSISRLHLKWRGKVSKDMPIYIDLIPTFPLESYNCYIDVFREPQNNYVDKSKYYLFWKCLNSTDLTNQIAFNDTEHRLISQLPPSAKQGFIYAKSLRIRDLIPQNVCRRLIHVDNLEESLKTYFLKTILFFCAIFIKQTHPRMTLVPLQWTYFVYKQLETRLEIGNIRNLFAWIDVTGNTSLVYCHCSRDLTPDEFKPCCVKRHDLLVITRWLIHVIEVVCEDTGITLQSVRELVEEMNISDDYLEYSVNRELFWKHGQDYIKA